MTNRTSDEYYMAQALELARRGRGQVEPNPMVGALIVCDGHEIARGWHKQFGRPHAEILALQAAGMAGADVAGCTMYVTLEPCSHFGKTPPCADALIAAKLGRVVIALEDPDPNVSGRGINRLRKAGIEVTTGLCQAQARQLLRAYLKLRTCDRPWVTLKWAQTREGCIMLPEGHDRWISCPESRQHVHRLRSVVDGILVGINTVLTDDPLLTNRSAGGKQPVRVVLDTHLRIDINAKLLNSLHVSPVLLAVGDETLRDQAQKVELLRTKGAEILPLPTDKTGLSLEALLDELGKRQWTHLLVEGGAQVHRSFLTNGLADELQVFVAPVSVNSDQASILPQLDLARVREEFSLPPGRAETSGTDRLETVEIRSLDTLSA